MSLALVQNSEEAHAHYPEIVQGLHHAFLQEIKSLKELGHLHQLCSQAPSSQYLATAIPSPCNKMVVDLWEVMYKKILKHAVATKTVFGQTIDTHKAEKWLENNHQNMVHRWRDGGFLDNDAYNRIESHYREVNPFVFWAFLEETYNPESVMDAAKTKAALDLISVFRLRHRPTIKRVGRHVEMAMTIYTEKAWRGEGRKMTYSSYGLDVQRLAAALRTVGDVSDLADVYALNAMADQLMEIGHHSYTIADREKHVFGGDLKIAIFHSEIKVYFPEPVAQAINVLIGMYGDLESHQD